MRKNFLSFLTAIFAIALVLSALTNAEASRQRLAGLGMDSDSYLMIEKDTITTTINPAALIGFPSLIGYNFGGAENASLFYKVSDTAIFHFLTDGSKSVNLFGAFGISSDTTIGFNAQYTTTSDGAASSDKQTASGTIGLLQKIGSDSIDFAATFAKEFGQTGPAANQKEKNLGTITVLARYNMAASETQRLHIYAKGIYDDSAMTDADTKDRLTITGQLGISDEIKLSDSSLAYVGLYNKYVKFQDPTAAAGYTFDVVALHFGVEGKLSDMFKGRMGVNKRLYNYEKYDGVMSKINVAGTQTVVPVTNLSMGLTAAIGQFRIDWVVNKQILVDGPNFINGAANNAFSTDVNVAYLFDTPVIK